MSDTQQISGGNQPFPTTDAELALSLITAGCQFARVEEGGPAQMHFTPDHLRSMWVTRTDLYGEKTRIPMLPKKPVSPEQFERAAMRAVALKNPGIVTYFIARDSVFREAMDAHDAIVKIWAEAARDKVAPMPPNLQTMTEAAMIMTVLYIRRQNKPNVESHAWVRPANLHLHLDDVRKTVKPKEGVPSEILEQMSYTAEGSGTVWSIDLPDEKRATIMSDGKPFIHPKPKL